MPQSSKSRSGKKRTTVKDLPGREKKLSKKDAKKIKGGYLGGVAVSAGTLAKKITVDPNNPNIAY